jgi:hypothetical protein
MTADSVSATRASVVGQIKFDVGYEITGEYLPNYLRFELIARDAGPNPSIHNLMPEHVTIGGRKLNKDGKPGTRRTDECFYNYARDFPEWVTAIINHEIDERKKGH